MQNSCVAMPMQLPRGRHQAQANTPVQGQGQGQRQADGPLAVLHEASFSWHGVASRSTQEEADAETEPLRLKEDNNHACCLQDLSLSIPANSITVVLGKASGGRAVGWDCYRCMQAQHAGPACSCAFCC